METSIACQSETSSSCDERTLNSGVSSIQVETPTIDEMVVQRQQDSSALPKHGEDAAHRAREILDSLKVRRETLLQTVRATCPTASQGSTDSNVTSHSSTTRRSLEELTIKSSRLKTCCFDGTESQLLTVHMAKVLQERRERLSRILAGMDPDDPLCGGPPLSTAKDDARDASPTKQETAETDNDTDDGYTAQETSAFVHDSEPSTMSDDDTEETDVVFTSMPPTLQEIEDAFSSTDIVQEGEYDNDSPECDDRETSVAAEEVEDRRCAMEQSESTSDENDGSTTGGFEPIASPFNSQGSPLSPILRANSFGDCTFELERGDSYSIRAALSFDSLFLDSKHHRTVFSHHVSAEAQRLAPAPTAARQGLVRELRPLEGRVESPDFASVKNKPSSSSLRAALTEPTASSCTPDSLDLNPHANEAKGEVSNEAKELPNFFPPARPVSNGDRSKLPKVTTVTNDCEDDLSKSGTALSSSSTLTTREERMGYLHNLTALHVKRPVPRYPPDEGLPADPSFHAAEVRTPNDRIGEDRVPSPHPGMFTLGNSDVRGIKGLAAASVNFLVDEEDRSVAVISDTSSFDGTYDDTVTSGYLSCGLSGRLNSLLGDDYTDFSILTSVNASFDESLDDAASVELLLRTTHGNPTLALETVPESTSVSIGASILSPVVASSTPLESCLLSSSGASRETRTTCVKRVAFVEVAPSPERTSRQNRKPPLLFVTEEVADSLCGTYGGLYSILLASENCAATSKGRDASRTSSPPSSLPVSKPLKRSAGIQFLRLNPDFRCGAQGSTYDICLQSGFDVTTPWQWTKRRKYLPVKGGLFDLAKKSGLSKEVMHSRAPLVVKTKPPSLCRDEDIEVLPEDVSDYECGATGNLFLAFESGGGDYVSKGSLYYLATRSGFKICQ